MKTALLLLATLSGLLAAALPSTTEVKIENFRFEANLTVSVGTTVVWTNRDDIPHLVVSKTTPPFSSSLIDTDGKYSHRFEKAGVYDYYCAMHPHMIGQVVVR